MGLDQDIAMLAHQENVLQFDHFSEDDGFALGSLIRDLAHARKIAVAIDIRLAGRPLFFCAMAGTGPDNVEWIRRKVNAVTRYLKSSYAIGRGMAKNGATFGPERGSDPMELANHGGAFPIRLKGTGVVGTIAVSGVPQRDDHMLVVEAIARYLGVDFSSVDLGPET